MKRTALLGALLFVLMLALPGLTLASSSCQTYNPQNCKKTTTTTPTPATTITTAPTAPTTTSSTQPTSTTTTIVTTTPTTTSSLPFTGADVGLLLAGGLILCAGGFVVRRVSRRFE